jgi:hypothetical protein
VSRAKSSKYAGKHLRQKTRRRRKVATAAGTMLFVAAAVAGEPSVLDPGAAGGAGDGLHGLTDPDSVGANGEPGEDARIGDEILDAAGDIDRLRQGAAGDLPTGPLMIPSDLYKAYTNAAQLLATEIPSCRIHWSLLASIGRIESNHARGGMVDNKGNTVPHILGPVLNGGGFAAIRDTDDGRLDDDPRWDRAVGAMQFIPSTWAGYAADGNNDGQSSPHNIYDATVAAGQYLCSGGLDLSKARDRAIAVFRYNHSDSYVRTVLIWADAYAKGVEPLPTTPVNPAQVAALQPPKKPGAQKPTPPSQGGGGGGAQQPPGSSPRPPSSSSRPPTSSSSSSTRPSCPTPTSTTSTTPPSTSPTTTPTCPTPPTSSTSSAPAETTGGEAGSSVVPTT